MSSADPGRAPAKRLASRRRHAFVGDVLLRRWAQLRADLPGTFLAALAIVAGYMAFTAWDQSHWWRLKPDYAFGWLVPLVVVFVIRDRWPRIVAALRACAGEGSPRAAGAAKWLLRGALAASLLLGGAMFVLGSFYRAGAGPSQPGTLAITLGLVGLMLPLLAINAPESAAPSRAGVFGDARVRLVALFLFPVLVWLLSAPMVSVIETQLNLALLRHVVTVVAVMFDTLGFPLEQQGNVLALPGGNVGVEEACSGIRSLTGCLFAGSFLAAVFVEKLPGKLALIGASLALAFVSNLARSLFLTAWAYARGPASIAGLLHDVTGYAVLALTALLLAGLLRIWSWRRTEQISAGRSESTHT